jgi:dUTP pyrophosphatase
MAARSSTHKLGLIPANGIGIGDEDFCGDNDEYSFLVYNVTDSDVLVEKGFRIAQLMVLNVERIEFEEVDVLGNKDRGGIGSTGLK